MLLAAQPNAVQFGPFGDDTPDTQSIAVRNMVHIPPSYVHLVLYHPSRPGLRPQPSGTLGASWGGGGGRHQRRTRIGVRGVAELVTLRAHTTKEPQRYTPEITTGIIARGNRCGPSNAPRRRTAAKPQVEYTTPGPAGAGPDTLGPD